MNERVKGFMVKVKNAVMNTPKDVRVFIGSMCGALALTIPTFAAGTSSIDVTGVDFSKILNEVTALIPVLLPVLIGFLAIRKGISFLLGMLRGA